MGVGKGKVKMDYRKFTVFDTPVKMFSKSFRSVKLKSFLTSPFRVTSSIMFFFFFLTGSRSFEIIKSISKSV